jgi:hypothetical protein
MKIHRKWTVFLGSMALCGAAHGYPKDHAPFQKGEAPPSVRSTACSIVKRQYLGDDEADCQSILYFAAPHDPKGTMLKMERLTDTNSCCWRITVLDGKGRPISTPATNDMPSYVYSVRSADLNQDGQTDFLVNIWSGGCGLAFEGSTTTFLLSSGVRYVTTDFYSFDFGPEDVVSFKKGGPCYFIHNDLIGNGEEKTKDGRDHNFWVYQLYRFSGSEMVEANGDDPRFPKWVWYTSKENHRETDQLTAAQKKRLLNPHSAQPDGAANGRQPSLSETSRPSSAAASRR